MDINYKSDLLKAIEENKKYLSSKDEVKEIPINTNPINKTEKSLSLTSPLQTKEDVIVPSSKESKKSETYVEGFEGIPDYTNVKFDASGADKIRSPFSTDIDFINGVGESAASAAQGIVNYGTQIVDNFKNRGPSPSDIANNALLGKKNEIFKTVNLSVLGSIPYVFDKLTKGFSGSSSLDSIINGSINTLSTISEVGSSFYDTDEIFQISRASFNQITNGGNLFGNGGIFGNDIPIGGGKPEIKIKYKKKDDTYYRTFSSEDRINEIDVPRNELGFLYIRPFENKIGVVPFYIPFQMNPRITEDGIQAQYASEQFVNRVGEVKTYISTSGLNLQFETQYTILSDGSGGSPRNTKFSSWMEYWTRESVKKIENAYRSLVFSTFAENLNDTTATDRTTVNGLLRPPIVRILMTGNTKSSSDLFRYPEGEFSLKRLRAQQLKNEQRYNWNKAFVVTGVTISNQEEDVYMMYDSDNSNYYYTGFKVSMTLTEITENYLDTIPDFKAYYDTYSNLLTPRLYSDEESPQLQAGQNRSADFRPPASAPVVPLASEGAQVGEDRSADFRGF